MENNVDKIFDKAKDIKLDSSEKEAMRGVLLSHIIRKPAKPRFSIFSIFPAPALAALFLIFSLVGISFAAENSMPGDLLYPVKVSVNEEIKVRTARSEVAKLNTLVVLAEKRVEETEKLAVEGKLDAKKQEKIESNFILRTDAIQEGLDSINKSGNVSVAADVSSRLEASLNAHENILSKLAEGNPKSKVHINSVLGKVKAVSKSTKTARLGYENDVSARANGRLEHATAVRLRASQESITKAKNLLTLNTTIDAETRAKAEQYIAEAEDIVLRAQVQESAKTDSTASSSEDLRTMSLAANPDPLIMLHEAIKLSNQAILMMQAQTRLNLKIIEFSSEASSTTSPNDPTELPSRPSVIDILP